VPSGKYKEIKSLYN